MKTRLLIAVSLMPLIALADDPLPKRPDFNRYQAMLTRSPFAIATVAVPSATPDFAKDLFVANAARSADGGFVTIASATDKNLKEYLSTKGQNEHGFAISDIQWSDQVGQTKVTITKDGKYATLTFNQALLSQTLQNPNRTGRVQVIFGGILLSGRAVNVRITPGIGRNCLHELLPTGRPGIG